jgi:hypothetical protein
MLNELRSHTDLVVEILRFEHYIKAGVEQFKAVALLKDSSRLHINEVWLEGRLHKYSYYWLTGTGQLIQGWDNAPHHPQLSTSPHHTHTPPDKVSESDVQTLAQVLEILSQRFSSL